MKSENIKHSRFYIDTNKNIVLTTTKPGFGLLNQLLFDLCSRLEHLEIYTRSKLMWSPHFCKGYLTRFSILSSLIDLYRKYWYFGLKELYIDLNRLQESDTQSFKISSSRKSLQLNTLTRLYLSLLINCYFLSFTSMISFCLESSRYRSTSSSNIWAPVFVWLT